MWFCNSVADFCFYRFSLLYYFGLSVCLIWLLTIDAGCLAVVLAVCDG